MSANEILNDQAKMEAMCKAIFDQIDKDKSGSIDVKELEQALQRMSKMNGLPTPTKADVQDSLNLFDKNKDGTIQFQEFVDVTREAYSKVAKPAR